MTTQHQIAIDLMNEVTSTFEQTTDVDSRLASYNRLFDHLLDHFPATSPGTKDTPERQRWRAEVDDLSKVLQLSGNELEAIVLTYAEQPPKPSVFVLALLKILIKVRKNGIDSAPIQRFGEFYRTHGRLLLEAAGGNLVAEIGLPT